MRKAHILRDNRAHKIPRLWLFFDCETEQQKINTKQYKTNFKIVSCIYWEREHGKNKEKIEKNIFENIDSFWEYVFSKVHTKEVLNLVAHNIDFDLTNLNFFEYIQKYSYKIKSFVDSNGVYILKIYNDSKKIMCIDSFNWFKSSVKDLGVILGKEKIDINFNTCTLDELKEYCMRDTEIIFETLRNYIEFISKNDFGNFKYTISAQSFTTFRHKFNNHKIFIHNRQDALEAERKSYFGGRNEAFYIGKIEKSEIYKLDVNSMYPFVMRNYFYPTKLIQTLYFPRNEIVADIIKRYCVIANVIVDTKEPIFPVKTGNKTIFPTGQFEAYLTTTEIKIAIQKGY
ncbi:MAG: DNA polymerase, partial [Desulfurella sp.]